MGGGPPGFTRDFTCPALLRNGIGPARLRVRDFHPLRSHLSRSVPLASPVPRLPPYNPGKQAFRFGLLRFRSPLLTESSFLSLPPGTEMFHFPGLAPLSLLNSGKGLQPSAGGVSPFGHFRIKACLRLPETFRSLPRPSSPSSAKASTARP